MTEIAQFIDLQLAEKLRDAQYRQKFFLAESSAHIAAQLIALRKRRGLNQKEVADLLGTRQPAISRIEQADYQNWSFNTLRSIADVLDARIRVYIEPSEDILRQYEPITPEDGLDAAEQEALTRVLARSGRSSGRHMNERVTTLQDEPVRLERQRLDESMLLGKNLRNAMLAAPPEQLESERLSNKGPGARWRS